MMLLPLPLLCCASQTHSAASRSFRLSSREINSFSNSISTCFPSEPHSGSISQSTNQSSHRACIGYPRKPCGFSSRRSFLLIKPPCILAIAVAIAFRSKPHFWHLRIGQKIYKRNNPHSPCYFSRSSPTNPYMLISGRSRPPFSGTKRECYSFAIIIRRRLSSTLRSAPLPTGKDPKSRLRMLRAVILRMLNGTYKIMKNHMNTYKI